MKKILIVFATFFCFLSLKPLLSQAAESNYDFSDYQNVIDKESNWIVSQQLKGNPNAPYYGAIKKTSFYEGTAIVENVNGLNIEYKSDIEKGTLYYSINPYFASNAVIDLLEVKPTSENKEAAKNWIKWYLNHMNENADYNGHVGTIYDYYVKVENGVPTELISANSYDSEDSYAARFLTLLNTYYKADKAGSAWIKEEPYASKIKKVIDLLMSLQDPTTGLTVAKKDYPIYYTMDNSEVYKGLDSIVWLSKHMPNASFANVTLYEAARNKVQQGILNELWDSNMKLFKVHKGQRTAQWQPYYADGQAKLFPLLSDVVSPWDSEQATILFNEFNNRFNATAGNSWSDLSLTYTNAAGEIVKAPNSAWVSCVAAKMGKKDLVDKYMTNALAIFIDYKYGSYSHVHPGYDSWTVSDAGSISKAAKQMQTFLTVVPKIVALSEPQNISSSSITISGWIAMESTGVIRPETRIVIKTEEGTILGENDAFENGTFRVSIPKQSSGTKLKFYAKNKLNPTQEYSYKDTSGKDVVITVK